ATQIVYERMDQDVWTTRVPDGDNCVVTTVDRSNVIAKEGGFEDSPLLDWTVSMIEIGGKPPVGHTATMLTSPITGKHYYIDNYMGDTELMELDHLGNGEYLVAEGHQLDAFVTLFYIPFRDATFQT